MSPWMVEGVATYFREHAIEVKPKTIQFGIGRPLDCHLNALEYATEHPGATPWFDFQLFDLYGESWWYLHSFGIDADSTLSDSGMESKTTPRYVAVRWGWELHDLIIGKETLRTSSTTPERSSREAFCSVWVFSCSVIRRPWKRL